MANPVNGRFSYPQSLRQLARRRHFNSSLTGFLLPNAIADYVYVAYDFADDDAIPLGTTASTEATATAFASLNTGVGGILRAQTGTTAATSAATLTTALLCWDAGKRPGMEVRFKLDAATNFFLEIGLSDIQTTATDKVVTDIDTPTIANGVTDGVFFCIDKSQTLTTAALVTDGTTAATAKTNIGTFSPTPDTWHTVLIQVLGSNAGAYCIVDNNPALSAVVTTGPDTAVPMRATVHVEATDTVNKIFDLDYMRFWQDR